MNLTIITCFIVSFALLLFSSLNGYFLGYPLFLCLMLFIVILRHQGFRLGYLLNIAVKGSQRSLIVSAVLIIIGVVIAIWMASGTVPALVYHGTRLISPEYFIIMAFLLTSGVSILIGTSFGTVGTIGIALMIMSRGSGINLNLAAGAIIAGAYVGDRCSPMSSSAVFIAGITGTNIYTNIKNMAITTIVPFGVTCLVYLVISVFNPMIKIENPLINQIPDFFYVGYFSILPAVVILFLSIIRLPMIYSMLISICTGIVIATQIQGYTLVQVIHFAIFGFHMTPESLLGNIFQGGGIFSMLKVVAIIIISTAFAGVIEGAEIFKFFKNDIQQIKSRSRLFGTTAFVGILGAMFGCTQTIAILLTRQLVQPLYKTRGYENYELSLDLENSVVTLSAVIPWNIACFIPAAILSTGLEFIPYAFYLYLLPLLYWVSLRLQNKGSEP